MASHTLSTKVIPQPVSRHTEASGLSMAGSIARSNVTAVVAYVHPLNARPERGADNFAVERRISLAEVSSVAVSGRATQAGILQPDFI